MKIEGQEIEVNKFVYLATCIKKHRDELKDIRKRIGLATKNSGPCSQ
jgi:hypothetical protein